MLIYVCPEDLNNAKRPIVLQGSCWYFDDQIKMFVRVNKDGNPQRFIAGKYLVDPDFVRSHEKREPSSATIAMWEFWQKARKEAA